MNGILLVPQQWTRSEWASQSCLHDAPQLMVFEEAGISYRDRLLFPTIFRGMQLLIHAWNTCFWCQSLNIVLFLWYSLECFSINRDIFPREWRDHADKSLGMGMPIIQSGWSHDLPNFIMETSIHVRPVFILVHHRVYSANVKTGIRTSITKSEQSWDRLNFIMGIPIKPTLFMGAIPENCYR